MEYETWWLLAIPLFFGLGWMAARIDLRHARGDSQRLPDAYFKGLNFLLNEQSDKAVDAFVDVVKLDPDTIELHFALGNLFRRRGETDRAIRVHQNLVERNDLDPRQREHALYELGQDFLKAGLLDRAEDAFNRLQDTAYGPSALRHRLEIAQMVRDWPAAIDLARRLARDSREDHRREIAHFHCELAARAMAGHDPARFDAARRALDAAAESAPEHPRPGIERGETARAEGDPDAAIAAWRRVLDDAPAYAGLVAPGWLAAYADLGRLADGIAALEHAYARAPSVDLFSAIAQARVQTEGRAAALAWSERALQQAPSLLGLEQLLGLRLAERDGPERAQIELTQTLIHAQARRLSRYVCQHCGFKARQFYWQCPGCNRWDTYAPRRSEELDRG